MPLPHFLPVPVLQVRFDLQVMTCKSKNITSLQACRLAGLQACRLPEPAEAGLDSQTQEV